MIGRWGDMSPRTYCVMAVLIIYAYGQAKFLELQPIALDLWPLVAVAFLLHAFPERKYMTVPRLLMLLGATVLYSVWFDNTFRAYQYVPWLIAGIILLFVFLLGSRLRDLAWWIRLLSGLAMGYVAAVIVSWVLVLRAWASGWPVDPSHMPGLAFLLYPFLSLGWLYGLLVAAILFYRSKAPVSA